MDERKARVLVADRSQIELRSVDLEGLLPADHRARVVWGFVEKLDLSPLYGEIKSVEGGPGRPGIDPAILMALWLYATLEGVGSARALARFCEEHDAYRWLRGGVGVNDHALADFRVEKVDFLDRVLTQSVASLMASGAVSLERVSQDGVRVRASAGAPSFRRRPSLQRCLSEAEEQVRRLRAELQDDPGATSRRQQAARERAAHERTERVQQALAELDKIDARGRKAAKPPASKPPEGPGEGGEPDEKRARRASTSDPEARVMKGADGGFRPCFNVQFSTDMPAQIIVGVETSNSGNDFHQLAAMQDQLLKRYARTPREAVVDGGFVVRDDIDTLAAQGTRVYAPVQQRKNMKRDPYEPLPTDSPAVVEWRVRMGTEQARAISKQRGAFAEWVNAQARNRGLYQFRVRGLRKVKAVALWYALAHNLSTSVRRGFSPYALA